MAALAGVFVLGALFLGAGWYLYATRPGTAGEAPKAGVASVPAPEGMPNVLLVIIDAMRADRLGASRNGQPLTPFLDSLAAEGAHFPHTLAQCTWTRPSMASLFTSTRVGVHQVYYGNDPSRPNAVTGDALSKEFETMAEYFKAAGFSTAGAQSNPNLIKDFQFEQGFDQYEFINYAVAAQMTDLALRQLDALKPPFFLYAHYMEPHLTYAPPEEYKAMMGWPPAGLTDEERKIAEDFMDFFWDTCDTTTGLKPAREFPALSDTGKDAVRLLYDGEVRYADTEVKRLVETLRKRHPNTLIIVAADHGEQFWDHDGLGHGLTTYDAEARVPLIIAGPGIPQGTQKTVAALIDLLPTLSAKLGLPARPVWQGRDLFTPGTDQMVFVKSLAPWPVWKVHSEAVRRGKYKLTVDVTREKSALFDVEADSGELHDLSAEFPAVVDLFKKALKEQEERNVKARRTEREVVELNPEIVEQLRDLGYAH